ncbi:hypothetical protein [Acidovorax sp. SDU_ACID1]|uniref:hypothetical protein n=1 Tax=Acidovorax sp. SDU_ACID1 TaxID=3136632 RepID=UPI0038739D2C
MAPQTNETPLAGEASKAKNQTTDAAILPHGSTNEKRFATLAARYALAGHCLLRTQPGDGLAPLYATHWGLIRLLASLDAAEAFLVQIGGAQ